MRCRLALILLLSPGCGRLDAVSNLADPVVAQGLFLGLDVPEAYVDDLASTEEFQYAALCNVFLAYVADPSELANAPVGGAVLTFRSPANGALTFREALGDEGEVTGKYTLDSSDGLVYEVGDTPAISFTIDGAEARLEVLAPESPDVELPGSFERESPLEVDLSDYAYQNAVAAAYDIDRGRMTWDNLPTAVDEVYEFTHTEEPIEFLEIPAEAFLRKSTYVVGVAGMEVADPLSFEGVNTSVSAFLAGQLAVGLVVVTE
ncbi:MAG: hypothetical protein Q8P18_23565 [Pseudomonadota bacterium]|nr:hypothetical protein [Pseudomonadota bacterium]